MMFAQVKQDTQQTSLMPDYDHNIRVPDGGESQVQGLKKLRHGH